ncbi:MAG TPA: hypothetical protein VHN14_23480 [Kofleriaceae bacterium]|nr:hypothetical protein [Kofleriaceae bacterium]
MAVVVACTPGHTPTPTLTPTPTPTPARTTAPSAPVPARPTPAGPQATGGAVPGYTAWILQSLRFIDGDHRLIGARSGYLMNMDPVSRRQLGDIELSSPQVPDPNGRPGVGETLSWNISEAVWAWDSTAHGLVGAIRIVASGKALSGLAVWRPGGAALPTEIPATAGSNCEPVAISPDARVVVARVIDRATRSCDESHAVQVFDLATTKPLSAPIDIGRAETAAFSQDGRYLAIGTDGKGAALYDLQRQTLAKVPSAERIQTIALRGSPPTVLWSTFQGKLESWQPGSEVVSRGEGEALTLSPDGRIAAAFVDNAIVLLDPVTLQRISGPISGAGFGRPTAIAFSEDSRQIAAAEGSAVSVWQLGTIDAAPYTDTGWFAALHRLPVPPPNPTPPIEHDAAIDGRVLLAGKPVANATVTLLPHHQEYADARALPPLVTHTGADGRYRFVHVPTILWGQSVTAPGTTYGGYLCDMRKTKVCHQDVTVERALTIRGIVRGPDQRPAAGVRVFHPGVVDLGDDEVDITTDRAGKFVIDHLRPKAGMPGYRITARRADGAVRSSALDNSKAGPQAITLVLVDPHDLSVLHVQVVDRGGKPVAGAFVSIEGHSVKTDARGLASLDYEDAVPGATFVRVLVDTGPRTTVASAEVVVPRREPVTIAIDR